MWTEPAYEKHPFYIELIKKMKKYIEIFFPGIVCELYEDPPKELNFQYLKDN